MILKILQCGHPVLREKGKRIERVTPAIRRLAQDMIETMHAANGVGLAAQQVGHALMLTVVDVRNTEQPSELWRDGQPQDIVSQMPLILLNPCITHTEGEQCGEEGCLSVPGITAPIRRAARLQLEAEDLDRVPLRLEATGLLARALQHEVDHLNGVLFLDRMDAVTRARLAPGIRSIQNRTRSAMKVLQ